MEKISGILPATARVTTVDLRNSGTSRAGMPSFGRQVGVTAAAEKQNELTTAARANMQQKDMMSIRNSVTDQKAAIVKDMADNFFMNRAKQIEKEDQMARIGLDETNNMQVAPQEGSTVNEDKVDDVKKEDVKLGVVDFSQAAKDEAAEEDAPAVGKYLDVQA